MQEQRYLLPQEISPDGQPVEEESKGLEARLGYIHTS